MSTRGALGRRAFLGLGVAAAAVAATGCQQQGGGSGSETSLELWSWMATSTKEWTAQLELFNEQHAEIEVNFNGYAATEYNRILTTGLSGSNGPDVAMLRSYGLLQNWVDAGDLQPLDDLVSGLENIPEEFTGGAQGRKDGKLYGVPMVRQSIHMYYNKALFAEIGQDGPPETWDEFVAICDTFAGQGTTPIALTGKDAWMLPIYAVLLGAGFYGGRDFEKAVLSGETDFTDPSYVQSLQLVDDLKKYYPKDVVAVGESDAVTLFAAGQAAMFPGGSFHLATILEGAPDLDLGVFAVPVAPGGASDTPVTPGYADASHGISAASEKTDAAVEVLNWMTTPEFGQFVVDKLTGFTPIPGVEYSNPVMAEMQAATDLASANYFLLTDFRYGNPSGTDLLGTGLQEMLLGKSTAEQVAQQLQDGVSTWFTPGE